MNIHFFWYDKVILTFPFSIRIVLVGLTQTQALALANQSNTTPLGHSECSRDVHVTQAGPMTILPENITGAIRREALSVGVKNLVECNLELLVTDAVIPCLGMQSTQREAKLKDRDKFVTTLIQF